jgi:hypothetical protein
MDNFNATVHRGELPQPLLEAIHKLVHTGASHQVISSVLGLKLEEVQQVLAKNPSQMAKPTESIVDKSTKCMGVQSNRLMTSHVMAPDGYYYEQSRFEAHPCLSCERVTQDPKKKPKTAEFVRESYLLKTPILPSSTATNASLVSCTGLV